ELTGHGGEPDLQRGELGRGQGQGLLVAFEVGLEVVRHPAERAAFLAPGLAIAVEGGELAEQLGERRERARGSARRSEESTRIGQARAVERGDDGVPVD